MSAATDEALAVLGAMSNDDWAGAGYVITHTDDLRDLAIELAAWCDVLLGSSARRRGLTKSEYLRVVAAIRAVNT